MKNNEYRQFRQRLSDAEGLPEVPQSMLDDITSQQPQPRGSVSVPLRQWPMVLAVALMLGAGAALFLRPAEQPLLVAENDQPQPSVAHPQPTPLPEAPKAVSISQKRVPPAPAALPPKESSPVIPIDEEPAPSASQPAPSPTPQPEALDRHPAEQILCYRNGQLVDCEEEATINTIMSFLS